MKQVLQSLRSGVTEIADVPAPAVKPGHLLVRTAVSLISPGTERMILEFSRANLLQKARLQPDRVRAAIDKVRADGLLPTLEAITGRLDQPVTPGYCNVGTVIEVGAGVTEFAVGDCVVSNGPHAEIVCVPKNLCAKLPEGVAEDEAAMTVLGAVALQGLRLAEPTLGESFAVIGLGLVGLLTVQLLRAQGCRVLGVDFDAERLKLAARWGAEVVPLASGVDPIEAAAAFSRGRGIDGVCIAAATSSNDPIRQAAAMCRKRGRIVLVGVAGLELSRADFYEKELSFRVSCSYGPGRYDPAYEQLGQDYPAGFVRWTAQRNFEAVLDLLADRRLDVRDLVTHRFRIDEADRAYDLLASGNGALGVLLNYQHATHGTVTETPQRRVRLFDPRTGSAAGTTLVSSRTDRDRAAPGIGFLGCGNFATRVLMPAFVKQPARMEICASAGGVSSWVAARKFRFADATTDAEQVLNNPHVDAVVIATRHDTHARYLCRALETGKHVFVEKPLALNREEIADIIAARQLARDRAAENGSSEPLVMVGFNRRFAPHVAEVRSLLETVNAPKSMILTVNAGEIPAAHWTQDAATGGGRIIGEACHHIDLLRHLCGHRIESVQATMIGVQKAHQPRDDKMTFILRFADGSFGTVHYLANGHRSFPKERLEIFCGGRVLQLDNFRKLRAHGWKGFRKLNLWRQDKGHAAEVSAFLNAVRQGLASPVPLEEAVEATLVSFDVVAAAHSGETVHCRPIVSPDIDASGANIREDVPAPAMEQIARSA